MIEESCNEFKKLRRKCLGSGFTPGLLYQEAIKELRTIGFSSFPVADLHPERFPPFLLLEGTPQCEKGVAPFSSLQGERILPNS